MKQIFVQLQKPQEDHHNHGGRPYPIHTKYEINPMWEDARWENEVRVTEFRSQEAFENQVDGWEHFMSVQEARGMWLMNASSGAKRSESIEKEYIANTVMGSVSTGKVVEIPYDSTK